MPQDVRSDHWTDPSISLGRKWPNITTACFFLTLVVTNFTALWYLKLLLYWWGWTLTCCQNNIPHFSSTCGCSKTEHCCWACTQPSSHDGVILTVSLKVSMRMEIVLLVLHVQNPHICSSNFSRYLATATASCNPCIKHIYNDNLLT